MKKILILLFIPFIFQTANGAVSKVNILKDKITKHAHSVNKLAAEIKDLDKKIGQNNDNYLRRVQEIEKLETKISHLKTELKMSAKNVSNEYRKTKLAFDSYLLEATDRESDHAIRLKKVYYEILVKNLSVLKHTQERSNSLLEHIKEYEIALMQKKQDEESIYNIIVDLENTKRTKGQAYISELEIKNLKQAELDTMIAKKRVKKRVARKASGVLFKVGLPVTNYSGVDASKKGVNFKYKESIEVKAPKTGKIVYVGELASYGNVIIIDHGQDVRSVILGDYHQKVVTGEAVDTGQIIGYATAIDGVEKNLYYEVRKKNITQKTLGWLNNSNLKI